MKRRSFDLAAICGLATLLAVQGLAGDVYYHITPIPKLPGTISSRASDVNDSGQVAGVGSFRDGLAEAWLWDSETGLTALGQLPGGRDSSNPEAINNLGWVVGVANSENGTEAFLWTPEDGMQGLGDLPKGGFRSWARGINNLNQVTGIGMTKTGDTKHEEAFLWDADNGMRSLGVLPARQKISIPADINDASQVVGWSAPAPFIWDRENGMRSIHDLPDGTRFWDPIAINNLGQVAGVTSVDRILQAAIWSERDGLMPLGTLGGAEPRSSALDINDRGQVIGYSRADSYAQVVDFIWDREHGMRALEDMIDFSRRGDYARIRITALNNRGQIVGYARLNSRAVLLTPFVLGDMNCDGSLDLGDVQGFLLALLDFEEYQKQYPGCHGDWAADTNQDGTVDPQDVGAFVGLLLK